MKNLQALFEEAMDDVKRAGIKPGNILSVSVDAKRITSWGICSYNSQKEGYNIEISRRLLDDSVDDCKTKETIIHEILHSCKGCMNHGSKWKQYTRIINFMYREKYNISVCTSNAHMGVELDESLYKYVVQCDECQNKAGYVKRGKIIDCIKRGEKVRCRKCGGTSFSIIKGDV